MNYIEAVGKEAINNKYYKWYASICQRAISRPTSCDYVEKHHILPRSFSLGGETDPSNIVYLSFREHILCHILLTKMFEGKFKAKMCYAVQRLIFSKTRYMKNYALLRLMIDRGTSGENHPNFGKVTPDTVKQKISKSLTGRSTGIQSEEWKAKRVSGRMLNGNPWHSKTTREKMSELKTGSKNPSFGSMWINNNVGNKKIKRGDSIPDGWVRGRLMPPACHT